MDDGRIGIEAKATDEEQVERFFRKLLNKIYEKMRHDEMIFGTSFIQLNLDKSGLLSSITFESDKNGTNI